tara:strand:- start:43 stop:519 length:477 start_codon:yes stop_codon:yes gene_type:complete
MALANKKSEELYNRKTGASADTKTIDATKETILQNAFNDKEYINDDTNLIFNAGLVYIVQQMQEDIEELRRYVSNDIDTLTTAQANAITANTAKVGITTNQSNEITTNTAKVSQGLNTSNMTMQFDVNNSRGNYTLRITITDNTTGRPVVKTVDLALR